MLTACAKDSQSLCTQNRDVIADIINHAEYDAQQTTVQIVDRETALNLLNKEYK